MGVEPASWLLGAPSFTLLNWYANLSSVACAVSCLVYSNRDQRCHGSVLIINFASPESTLQGPLKRIISFVGSTDGICGFALRSEVKVSSGFHLCVLLSFGLNTFYIVMLILIWDLGDKPQRKVCGLIAVCVCAVKLTWGQLCWLVSCQPDTRKIYLGKGLSVEKMPP